MKFDLRFLTILLALLPYPAFSSVLSVAGADHAQKNSLQKQLIKAGLPSALFNDTDGGTNEGSIVVSAPAQLDHAVTTFKTKQNSRGFLVLVGKNARKDKIAESLHGLLSASRIFVETKPAAAVKKINAILREQKRLKQGIAGLGTIPTPEDGLTFAANDFRTSSPVAPLGSAVLTRAGLLEATGIRAIIHTASGSMMRSGAGFEPSIKSIQDSIINAVALAREDGHQRVALPIIAGSIFAARVGLELCALTDLLVNTLAQEAAGIKFILTVRANNAKKEGDCLRKSVQSLSVADQASFEISDQVEWAIVKFKEHQATAIINSANMEVQFGGGVSAVIGDAADGVIPSDQHGGKNTTLGDYRDFQRLPKNKSDLPSNRIDREAYDKILLFRVY